MTSRPSSNGITLATFAAKIGWSVASLRDFSVSAENVYGYRSRRKADGGLRQISAPSVELRALQRKILSRVLRRLSGNADLAAARPRDVVVNAKRHQRQTHSLAVDIANAFPATSAQAVARALTRQGFTREAARLVVRLCTDRDSLPQGAPTSNALLDLVFVEFDREMLRICRERGGHYSRYVDNLVFTAPTELSWIERRVEKALGRMGYTLRESKTQRGGGEVSIDITGIETGTQLRVRATTVKRVAERLADAAADPSESRLISARSSLNWILRVNPHQAAAVIRHHVPSDEAALDSLRSRRKRPISSPDKGDIAEG
jgi:RNA-directed DNA polymerase